jgi:flagellar P-ring protein precursor FlgI
VICISAHPARADRLLDLCDVVGVRDNQLVGYGVVTGLNGTGDDVSAPFAMQSLRSLLRRLGVQVDQRQLRLRNVAAVLVTATIPPFSRSGARLDITVSSIGNACSLRGGVLVQTPLRGADRKVYAVGQGSLIVGGFSAEGSSGSGVQENITTTARIPGGALGGRGRGARRPRPDRRWRLASPDVVSFPTFIAHDLPRKWSGPLERWRLCGLGTAT